MYAFTEHRHRVPFEHDVALDTLSTAPPADAGERAAWRDERAEAVDVIAERQRVLWALDTHAVLCVFQGMDASGKDGAVRKVFSGVNPAGCHVHAFGPPSDEDLSHDFLWRVQARLPARGRIGVFNRSHYEDVLIVRVHPELLERSRLRSRKMLDRIWDRRFRAIRDWEQHLADNGTVILKFFLHLSREEQRRRFLARIDRPHKHWKFDVSDVRERQHWDAYQRAYEDALAQTSRPWAPWYAIPADDKRYASTCVARIVAGTLERLDLDWPKMDDAHVLRLQEMRAALAGEAGPVDEAR